MDSHRQKIVSAVAARLAMISPANGYQTNIGSKVHIWRSTQFGPEDLPGINIRDTVCETEGAAAQIHLHKLTLEIEALVSDGLNTPATCRKAAADLLTCIGKDRFWTVDGVRLAYDTRVMSEELAVEQEGIFVGGVALTIQVWFRTESFNPYVQR